MLRKLGPRLVILTWALFFLQDISEYLRTAATSLLLLSNY